MVRPEVISTQALVVTEQESFTERKVNQSEEKNLSVNKEMERLKERTAKLICTYLVLYVDLSNKP